MHMLTCAGIPGALELTLRAYTMCASAKNYYYYYYYYYCDYYYYYYYYYYYWWPRAHLSVN